MTFRHPLRNDWDRLKPLFDQAAGGNDTEAVLARAMLKIVPPFLDVIEDQRDRATPPSMKLTSGIALAGMIIENAIETAYPDPRSRRAALAHVLQRVEHAVVARLLESRSSAGVLLPGLGV